MTRSTIPAYVDTALDIMRSISIEDPKTHKNKMIAIERIGQAQAIVRGALDRMVDALPGPVGSRAPDAESGGRGVGDPTGEAAIRHDPVTADRIRIAGSAGELLRCARAFAANPTPQTAGLVEIVASLLLSALEPWAPREAHDGERARGAEVRACESCIRLRDRSGRELFIGAERVDGRYVRRNIDGRSMHLCYACANFAKANKRRPTIDELRRYHDTGRWRVRAA